MFITRRWTQFLHETPSDGGGDPTAPTTEAPADGAAVEPAEPAQPTQDWEKVARDNQAWGTRLAQEKAELEQEARIARALRSDDPEERRKAFESLGMQFIDDDGDDDGEGDDEPGYAPDPRLDDLARQFEEFKQWRDGLTETQQREQQYEQYRKIADPQLKEMGVPEGLHDVIAEAALNLPAVQTPQGPQPDLQGAWEQFAQMSEHFAAIPAVQTAVKKSWQQTKPRAATTTPNGMPATGVPQFEDGEARREYMRRRVAAEQG